MNPFYNKKKKGYTLAEVLATVAILLILMAIAVPAIFSIRKNLRQKALDNKAELIYTAVQNNLVKLQSNGNSSLYDGKKQQKLWEGRPQMPPRNRSFITHFPLKKQTQQGRPVYW